MAINTSEEQAGYRRFMHMEDEVRSMISIKNVVEPCTWSEAPTLC